MRIRAISKFQRKKIDIADVINCSKTSEINEIKTVSFRPDCVKNVTECIASNFAENFKKESVNKLISTTSNYTIAFLVQMFFISVIIVICFVLHRMGQREGDLIENTTVEGTLIRNIRIN